MLTFARKPKTCQGSASGEHAVIGDHAAQRMLQKDAPEAGAGLFAPALSSSSHDFSRISIHPPGVKELQTERAVNTPADSYELEADRLADRVMRGCDFPRRRGVMCPQCQSERPGGEPKALQISTISPGDMGPMAAPPIVDEALRSPGQPLDPATRAYMEPRFGHDFSRVRVHSGAVAGRSAADVNALAYTVGHHIVFGGGQFSVDSSYGRRLLAHELVHVIQQGRSRPVVQCQTGDSPKGNREVANARARGRAMADAVRKEGKLSPALRAKINHDLAQLDGAAKDAYSKEIKPTLEAMLKPTAAVPAVWSELGREVKETFLPVIEGGAELVKGGPPRTGTEKPEKPGEFIDYDEYQKVKVARDAFHSRHSGYSKNELQNIDDALWKVTRNNPTLLIAYYNYYADHRLGSDVGSHHGIPDLGDTAGGDTDINPRVVRADAQDLSQDPKFVTSDPISFLGGTLIHEYVHTPQGSSPIGVAEEAKAYGVERFLSRRMGDEARERWIENRYDPSKPDPYDQLGGGEGLKLHQDAFNTMERLYKIIDAGGPDAEKARVMSVDFISHNADQYGPELKAFLAKSSP